MKAAHCLVLASLFLSHSNCFPFHSQYSPSGFYQRLRMAHKNLKQGLKKQRSLNDLSSKSPRKSRSSLEVEEDKPNGLSVKSRKGRAGSVNQLAPPTENGVASSSPGHSPRTNKKESPRRSNSENTASTISSADSNVYWRTAADRSRNPTQLNFDRKRLQKCKKIKDDPDVELINYQHNLIEKIEYLDGFRKLVFLDFYDNRLAEMSGLSNLPSLKVLMLGKNQIREIGGLEEATGLDVLDLHSNLILKISKINHLKHLRILNLSGNQISQVENIDGLKALTEFNLRRNRIHVLRSIESLHQLEKLFLSYNELVSEDPFWDQLSECPSLVELTLDGNPLAAETHYKTTVLKCLPKLKQLDMRKITEGERRVIERAIQKEAERQKKADVKAEKVADRAIRIQAAQEAWEAQQEDLEAENKLLGASLEMKPERTVLFGNEKPGKVGEKGYAEILGNSLKFYGKDSLSALDKNWGYQAMSSVTDVKFKFVDFNIIAETFAKLKIKFPRVQTLIFSHTNLVSYQQINTLTAMKKLHSIVVTSKGNPLTSFTLWKEYVAYKLGKEMDLAELNSEKMTEEKIQAGEATFRSLDKTYTGMSFTMRLVALAVTDQADKNNAVEGAKKLTNAEFVKLLTNTAPKNQKLSNAEAEASKLLAKAELEAEKEEKYRNEVDQCWQECFNDIASAVFRDIYERSSESYLKDRLKKFAAWKQKHSD